jgi:hypothetical protein
MTPKRQSVVLGVLLVARGRVDGIGHFGGTSQAFLSSLAPLLAFPLVGTLLGLATDGALRSISDFVMYLCALLTPAVLSYELARWWGRGEMWLRFATAFNWCEWILPVVGCILMVPVSLAMSAGLDSQTASMILLGGLAAYGLWLHWFLARHALSLSRLKALLLVFIVNVATVLVVAGPRFIAMRVS